MVFVIAFQKNRKIRIIEENGWIVLKNDIRMMNDVKTEKTGFMGLAVYIRMMMKVWGKNGKPKNNQQKGSELSEIGAR